ncbi:YqkE family protein [Bacillus spongiae]|uniref:YqkE family protein n=1 Tax=Bacillus spongiae TaxID=2683610 RepID=A0ABU8HDG9_9BACI
MSKKRKQPQRKKETTEKKATLKDALDVSLLQQLQNTKKELEIQEVKKKQLEAKRKEEERKQKEKNKSFEQLLQESQMDWKEFKD